MTSSSLIHLTAAFFAVTLISGCGGGSSGGSNQPIDTSPGGVTNDNGSGDDGGPTTPPGEPDPVSGDNTDLWDPNSILTAAVNLSEADWNTLRNEGNDGDYWPGCLDYKEYTYFEGNVTINGQTTSRVSIRKKGALGSLSNVRPSLKLNFGRGEEFDGRTFEGEKRFTLNNNKQDPALVRQCLTYYLFDAAGIRSPRCNFARVYAQNNDLGLYTHVEAIKKPFIERVFGDDSGNLYEGQGSDFSPGMVDRFQLKTNKKNNDRSDLQRVIQALAASDANVWNRLNAVVDMDEYLTYSAIEALIAHRDGYSMAQNNFYMYHSPVDDKFHFIPWGVDTTFSNLVGPLPQDQYLDESAYLANELSARIWRVAALRDRYDARMRELLSTVWNETDLHAQATRMAQLTGASLDAVEDIHTFIDGRRAKIESQLGDGSRTWPTDPLRNYVEPALCNR